MPKDDILQVIMTEGTPIPVALRPDSRAQAPQEARASSEYDNNFDYRAALIKRFGRPMTPEDYRIYGSELWTAASDIFGGVTAEINRDRYEGGGTLHSNSWLEEGQPVPLEELTPEGFEDLFATADSVVMDLTPTVERPQTRSGWVQMRWERRQGSKLFFYGQGGSATQDGVAPNLYRRLFPKESLPWSIRLVQGRKVDKEDLRAKEAADADYISALASLASYKSRR